MSERALAESLDFRTASLTAARLEKHMYRRNTILYFTTQIRGILDISNI